MKVRLTKSINAPLGDVFDVFSDITKIEERIPEITKIEILSEKTAGTGTKWRETRVMFGQEATEEMEITNYEKNASYTVEAHSNGTLYVSTYIFKETDSGTQVDFVFDAKPQTLMSKLMSPMGFVLKGPIVKAFQADMDALAELLESSS